MQFLVQMLSICCWWESVESVNICREEYTRWISAKEDVGKVKIVLARPPVKPQYYFSFHSKLKKLGAQQRIFPRLGLDSCGKRREPIISACCPLTATYLPSHTHIDTHTHTQHTH